MGIIEWEESFYNYLESKNIVSKWPKCSKVPFGVSKTSQPAGTGFADSKVPASSWTAPPQQSFQLTSNFNPVSSRLFPAMSY